MIGNSPTIILGSILYFLIWNSYFNHSKRVKVTYQNPYENSVNSNNDISKVHNNRKIAIVVIMIVAVLYLVKFTYKEYTKYQDIQVMKFDIYYQVDNQKITADEQKAVDLVKSHQFSLEEIPLEEQIYTWVKYDNEANVIYGWHAQMIDEDTYSVSYNFDDDNDQDNGWFYYCYEANIKTQVVEEIEENIEEYTNLESI